MTRRRRPCCRSERDLITFGARVLRRLRPAALLVSGDLTDSKTARAGTRYALYA